MAILFINLVALSVTIFVVFAIARELIKNGFKNAQGEEKLLGNNNDLVEKSHSMLHAPSLIPHRIKALIFGWEFPPHNSGGLGVACQGIAEALQKDTDVVFVLPKELPKGASSMRFLSARIPLYAIHSTLSPYPGSRTHNSGKEESNYGDDIVSQVRRYARAAGAIAAREPHDIIYAHDWLSFGAGMEAKKISGKPLIAHVHATEFERSGFGSINQTVYDLEREGLHAADAVIAVSHLTKKCITEQYGIAPEKIHVVWNGIDEKTAPLATMQSSTTTRLHTLKQNGNKLVLFMGRLTVQKGADYLLRAAAIALKKDPHIYFLIAGAGHMRDQIIEEAANLGIASRVLFTGFLRGAEQSEAYALADLFVMPSVSEPFGITALEAMRAGTPTLISKQSGAAEAVSHVFRTDFWDVEEMARHIDTALHNSVITEKLRLQAGKEVAGLTWDLAASKIRIVMDSLLLPQLAYQPISATTV